MTPMHQFASRRAKQSRRLFARQPLTVDFWRMIWLTLTYYERLRIKMRVRVNRKEWKPRHYPMDWQFRFEQPF